MTRGLCNGRSTHSMDLNQITIPCNDYDASVSFYSALGLRQIVDSPPDYARFEAGNGATISIHRAAVPESAGFVVYFEVGDVDGTVSRLKNQGLVFDQEPADQRWLWREAYLRDPAGNRVCIYYAGLNRRYPPWRI